MTSYPYYAKFTEPGDRTYFKHVDCNLEWAHREGTRVETIQGSVSLNNEDNENCTLVLQGFYNILSQYLQQRADTSIRSSNRHIEAQNNKEDQPNLISSQYPTVVQEKTPCNKGRARILSLLLPHRSTSPATQVRRTIFPQVVIVRNSIIENLAISTYEEICKAYRNLTATPKSPSGHSNRYRGIKQAFLAKVYINYQFFIQKAFIRQLSQDNNLVRREVQKFQDYPKGKIQGFINQQRTYVISQIKHLQEVQKAIEIQAYAPVPDKGLPSRSYFTNKGKHPKRTGAWQEQNADYTQSDALSRLANEITLEPDKLHHFLNSPHPTVGSPTNTEPSPRSRSNTLQASDVSVYPSPTPATRRSKRDRNKTKRIQLVVPGTQNPGTQPAHPDLCTPTPTSYRRLPDTQISFIVLLFCSNSVLNCCCYSLKSLVCTLSFVLLFGRLLSSHDGTMTRGRGGLCRCKK